MDALLDAGLANALVATILAPIAAIFGRMLKRPAVTHALWLILLLKLVTPPWIAVPVVPAMRPSPPPAVVEDGPVVEVFEVPDRPEPPAIEVPQRREMAMPSWRGMVSWAWLAGSAAWLILASWRVLRFASSLRRAESADHVLQSQVDDWAARIGLRKPPDVVLVPGRVSPLVWALGTRGRLVLPEAFWKRLDADQKAALVIHELAHLRRGDHRVRLLEMLATGLFWWHPALWWARRGLHEAEEQCCDLWVVWAMPDSAKTYASTLVEAVDFLCEGGSTLPIGASGMGQFQDLSRRIGMILRGTTPRSLSRTGWLMMLGLAALLLPLRPSWSQEPKPDEMPPPAVPQVPKPVEPPHFTPLQTEIERAETRLNWAEKMHALGYLSDAQLRKDREAFADAKAQSLQKNRQELLNREIEFRQLGDELERLEGQLPLKAAHVKKAEAGRDVAAAETGRIRLIEEKNPVFISRSEKAKAEAELAIAEAGIAEANADLQAVHIQIRQGKRRFQELEERIRQSRKRIQDLEEQYREAKQRLEEGRDHDKPDPAPDANPSEINRVPVTNRELTSLREKIESTERQLERSSRVSRQPESDPAVVSLKKKLERDRAKLAERLKWRDWQRETNNAKPQARDADQRLADVETKLDRVLQELEAIRKEKGISKEDVHQVDIRVLNANGEIQETIRSIFREQLHREPLAEEMKEGMEKLSAKGDRDQILKEYRELVGKKPIRPGFDGR